MRRVLFALCVLCCTASAAQKVVKAKTDRVTVYFDGAVVEKLARVDLQKGENTIIFSSNSPTIEPYGIQFDADEGFMVVGFDAETGLPQEFVSYEQSLTADKRKHYKSLCDTIAKLKDALQFEQSRKASLEKQFAALSSIKLMSNPQSQDSLQRIKTTLEYYDQKSAELTKSKMATEAKIKQYNELLKKQQYLYAVFMEENPDNTSSAGQNSREYKIKADIYADKDISGATIRYSYLCTAAGWRPLYDVRLSSAGDDARFVLKADLFNNSGEDWSDVELTFASESVRVSDMPVLLRPNYLSNLEQRNFRAAKYESLPLRSSGVNAVEQEEDAEVMLVSSDKSQLTNYTTMTTSSSSLFGREYTVGMRHSIKNNTQNKTIPVQSSYSQAGFKYLIKPKASPKAYLQAAIPDWQKLELAEAEANVYFDNKYATRTVFNPANVQTDTMLINMGVDKRVSVSRKVNKTTPNKASIVGKELETTVEVEIKVKNNKSEAVNVEIEDQIPISTDAAIKIQTLDLQQADYEPLSGRLLWNKQLGAGESLVLKVKYSVRYPKDYCLNLN